MISHSHKTIFIHAPKCAGESIETLFLEKADRGFKGDSFAGSPEKHWSAIQYREAFPVEFDRYFKFSIIRNPWDRMISWVKYRDLRFNRRGSNFRQRLLNDLNDHSFRKFCSTMSYTRLLTDNRQLIVDHVCRMESLKEDLESISDAANIDFTLLPRKNATIHGPFQDYYNNESRCLVAALYANDIALFGYNFSDSL